MINTAPPTAFSSTLPMSLSVTDVALDYGQTRVLDNIGFTLARGEVMALLGPSGCGKTTLLRLIAGLLRPDRGRIEISGTTVADVATGRILPPEKRGLGMVFQDYALWPHLTVAENVGFPLDMKKVPTTQRRARIMAALDRVGLSAMAERRPSDLSGGQQQRVAIARAIVAEPPLVLFDEPLSNLDRELRETMVEELGQLVSDLGLSAVYVTHDQTEAFALANRIAIMRRGLIRQCAAPDEIANAPASPEIAEFLRLGGLISAVRDADGWHVSGTTMRLHGAGPDARTATVLLPEAVVQIGPALTGGLQAEVTRVQMRATGYQITLRFCGTNFEMRKMTTERVTPGTIVGLSYPQNALRWFAQAH